MQPVFKSNDDRAREILAEAVVYYDGSKDSARVADYLAARQIVAIEELTILIHRRFPQLTKGGSL